MGGRVNYALLAPGILFLAIAVAGAISISQRGWGSVPLWLTIGLIVIVGAASLAVRSR